MVVAFVLTVPYALLDLPGFLNGLAFDAFHYSNGHDGANVTPGWPEAVAYTSDLLNAFGLPALLIAEIGACVWLVRDARRFVTLSAFALTLLRMLVHQRVHFERNVLPVFVWVAACAAYGCVFLHERLLLLLARRGFAAVRWARPVVAVVLWLAVTPFWRVRTLWVSDRTDSRTLAETWLARHVPARWTVVLPS